MPLFKYIAKTREGKTNKGIIEAGSSQEVIRRLQSQNLIILSVQEVGKEKKGAKETITKKVFASAGKHSRITQTDLAFFARNISITLAAGVPLLRSLEIISYQTESLGLSKVIMKCNEYIKKGLSFSEAIEKFPQVFPSLWKGIIEVGEVSGNLPFVLDRLANYLEMRLEFERKLKSALVYPMMVGIFSIIAVIIFFKFILPKFTEIFNQFNIELPVVTKILFKISNAFNEYFLIILMVTAAIVIGIIYFKKTPSGKSFFDRLGFSIPVYNKMMSLSLLERFSSTASILLESGVPILYTLEVIIKSIDNVVFAHYFEQVKEHVRAGKNLSGELEKIPIFPPLVSEIVKIGEEAGNMPSMFEKLSKYYQKELSTQMERFVAMFEPLMIFILGLIIGVVVVALFMPIFKMASLGQGG